MVLVFKMDNTMCIKQYHMIRKVKTDVRSALNTLIPLQGNYTTFTLRTLQKLVMRRVVVSLRRKVLFLWLCMPTVKSMPIDLLKVCLVFFRPPPLHKPLSVYRYMSTGKKHFTWLKLCHKNVWNNYFKQLVLHKKCYKLEPNKPQTHWSVKYYISVKTAKHYMVLETSDFRVHSQSIHMHIVCI